MGVLPFPDEPRDRKGKFSNFSKRQTTYRKQKRVSKSHDMEMKDFHSFRHTVETKLSDQRYSGSKSNHYAQGIIDAIIGHASEKRSVGEAKYDHAEHLRIKHSAVNGMKYTSVQFSEFMPWDKCKFARTPFHEKTERSLKIQR